MLKMNLTQFEKLKINRFNTGIFLKKKKKCKEYNFVGCFVLIFIHEISIQF